MCEFFMKLHDRNRKEISAGRGSDMSAGPSDADDDDGDNDAPELQRWESGTSERALNGGGGGGNVPKATNKIAAAVHAAVADAWDSDSDMEDRRKQSAASHEGDTGVKGEESTRPKVNDRVDDVKDNEGDNDNDNDKDDNGDGKDKEGEGHVEESNKEESMEPSVEDGSGEVGEATRGTGGDVAPTGVESEDSLEGGD
eukprot:GFYU01004082.1.p2 GENE.GFYU01004082.1~~GFYU01004082.1.p2  ORF type:complete len:216 (+),score=77.10 GFYU01004082.1:56-649(+)